MMPSPARNVLVVALGAAALIALATIAGSCATLGAAAGFSTLDSAQAVAIAQRNLCGGASGPTCAVHDYRRVGDRYIVTLDRRPPAGNDRVVVTLLHNGTDIQAAQADSVAAKP